MALDGMDRRILAVLQKNGRISHADLSERVNLSPSACHRRVQRLEQDGYIRGYVAMCDPKRVGKPTTVFVEITLAGQADEVFGTIRDRLDHLNDFIDGYARFARLPQPRKRRVDWGEFVGSLAELPELEVVGRLPATPGWFDPAQMQQVVVNLVKNAVEASNGAVDVKLRIDAAAGTGAVLQVVADQRGAEEDGRQRPTE